MKALEGVELKALKASNVQDSKEDLPCGFVLVSGPYYEVSRKVLQGYCKRQGFGFWAWHEGSKCRFARVGVSQSCIVCFKNARHAI